MTDYPNHVLTGSQQKAAAEVLGAAFAQDPFMTYVFPNAKTRKKGLAALFLPVIRCNCLYGGVELAPSGDSVLGWLSGEYLPLNMLQLIRSGLIWTPLKMGAPAFKRLQGHDGFCEHKIRESAPPGFAYLWIVGVHPKAAGQGLGKQMIQTALSAMRRRGHSTCLLRTDSEKNVPFYKHLGFQQIHAGIVPDSQLPYWLFSQDLNP